MIQKLSARCPDTEIRLKVLEDIATEIGVILHLELGSTMPIANVVSKTYSY